MANSANMRDGEGRSRFSRQGAEEHQRSTLMLKWLWLSVVVLGLDQLTKQLAEHYLSYHDPLAVMASFNLMLAYNVGAAFSFLSDAGGWQRWFFVVLALGVSAVIVVWMRGLHQGDSWFAAALALILGGALGNVLDRLLYGHVIDFLDVYYKQWHWPTFNLADSAITVGVCILVVDGLLGSAHKRRV